jgi:hypothetical protein
MKITPGLVALPNVIPVTSPSDHAFSVILLRKGTFAILVFVSEEQ